MPDAGQVPSLTDRHREVMALLHQDIERQRRASRGGTVTVELAPGDLPDNGMTVFGCPIVFRAGAHPRAYTVMPPASETRWCPVCEGNREINICPIGCDGSHVHDYPTRCPDCFGTGKAPAEPDQCSHCGHYLDREEGGWVDAQGDPVCHNNTGGLHEPFLTRPPASDLPASVSPEQTPSPAADSAHSGDHSTVGETP